MKENIKVTWEGALFVHHSLAMVNRELLLHLNRVSNFSLSHIPYEPDQFEPVGEWKELATLREIIHEESDIYIRHRWPPKFERPNAKKVVLYQPWEFGSIPLDWVHNIQTSVDEVWTSSSFSKQAFVDSGVPDEKVFVVPQGINPQLFKPDTAPHPALSKVTEGKYAFLFIGGATLRKGVDILVNAYLNTFSKDENVILIIKGSPMYGDDLAKKIMALSERDDIPPILYLLEDVSPEDLPLIYKACDVYVQPYRAEGFCLPIAEAMGCGLPTIVTGAGACLDFTSKESSLYIESFLEKFDTKRVEPFETTDYPYWYVPYVDHLSQLMRVAYENQTTLAHMGEYASSAIRKNHTWQSGAEFIAQRIKVLTT